MSYKNLIVIFYISGMHLNSMQGKGNGSQTKQKKLHYKKFNGKVIDIPVNLCGSSDNAGTVSLSLPF